MASTAPTTRPILGRIRPCQPVDRRAVRGRDPPRGGPRRGRGPARRPDRQAHRSLAGGQVHRRRARQPRQDLVGSGQPADLGGRLRSTADAADRLPRRPRPVQPGLLHRRAPRPIAGRCGSTRRRPGPASSRATCSAGRRAAQLAAFEPNFTIICVPSFEADPEREGTRTGTAILVHLRRMEIIIVGTEYAGEIKKSAFTVMNYLMPDEGVLPMHCGHQRRPGRRPGGLLRALRHRQDDPVGRPAAQPHRRRRARLGRRHHVQLRGRLLRQDDPPVADVRAGHLRDHPSLRDDPRERRPRPADPRARPRLGAVHREHARRLPARLHRQRRRDRGRRARPGRSCS